MPAEFISQSEYPSTTPRTLERTSVIAVFDDRIRACIRSYLAANPEGTQITLAVLDDIGQEEAKKFGKASRRSLGEVKQVIGLRVPILLSQLVGAENVSTYRDPKTKRCSTRTRSKSWHDLTWVSRYTPHKVSAKGLACLG